MIYGWFKSQSSFYVNFLFFFSSSGTNDRNSHFQNFNAGHNKNQQLHSLVTHL